MCGGEDVNPGYNGRACGLGRWMTGEQPTQQPVIVRYNAETAWE